MNNVSLMGRLTKDPELRYTTTKNVPVASFTLAVNRQFARQGEERQADFINIVAWDKSAEFVSKYFKKGQQVAVTGRIQARSWDDDKGVRHWATEVIAERAFFADSKAAADANYSGDHHAPSSGSSSGNNAENSGFFPLESNDDELPF